MAEQVAARVNSASWAPGPDGGLENLVDVFRQLAAGIELHPRRALPHGKERAHVGQGDAQIRGGQKHQADGTEFLRPRARAQLRSQQRIAQGMRRVLEKANEARQWDLLVGIGEAGIPDMFTQQTIDRSALAAQFLHDSAQHVGADGWRGGLLGHRFTVGRLTTGNGSSITAQRGD